MVITIFVSAVGTQTEKEDRSRCTTDNSSHLSSIVLVIDTVVASDRDRNSVVVITSGSDRKAVIRVVADLIAQIEGSWGLAGTRSIWSQLVKKAGW